MSTIYITGAGVSSESGIPTFRGQDGFWTVGSVNYTPQEMATREMYLNAPDEFLLWYFRLFAAVRNVMPVLKVNHPGPLWRGRHTKARGRFRLNEMSDYWEEVLAFYKPFDTSPRSGSAEVYEHEMPGGQFTNLKEQANAMASDTAGRRSPGPTPR